MKKSFRILPLLCAASVYLFLPTAAACSPTAPKNNADAVERTHEEENSSFRPELPPVAPPPGKLPHPRFPDHAHPSDELKPLIPSRPGFSQKAPGGSDRMPSPAPHGKHRPFRPDSDKNNSSDSCSDCSASDSENESDCCSSDVSEN